MLKVNEDGSIEEIEPYGAIVCATKEDFEKLRKAMQDNTQTESDGGFYLAHFEE